MLISSDFDTFAKNKAKQDADAAAKRVPKHFPRSEGAAYLESGEVGTAKTTVRVRAKRHVAVGVGLTHGVRLEKGDTTDMTEDEFAQHSNLMEKATDAPAQ